MKVRISLILIETDDNKNSMDGYRLTADGQDFFTSYDEVYDSFDSMGLQENLLRGIYAYGKCMLRFPTLLFFCCFNF